MSDSIQLVAALGGELITYLPYGGVAMQFKAIVERRPQQVDSVAGYVYGVNTLEVFIPNDAMQGMTAIQPRKDRVRFKRHVQDANETEFTVQVMLLEDEGLVASDGGMFRLVVQS